MFQLSSQAAFQKWSQHRPLLSQKLLKCIHHKLAKNKRCTNSPVKTLRNNNGKHKNTITACHCHKGAPEDAAIPLSKALPSQTPAATAGLDLGHQHLGTAESLLYSFLRVKLPCLLIVLVFGAAWYITYNRQCYRDMRYYYLPFSCVHLRVPGLVNSSDLKTESDTFWVFQRHQELNKNALAHSIWRHCIACQLHTSHQGW